MRLWFIGMFLILLLVGFSMVARAQSDAGVDAPAAATQPTVPAPVCDLKCQLDEAKTAYQTLKAAQSGADQDLIKFAWAGLIAAILKILIQLLERLTKLTDKGKKVIPLIAMGIGVLIAMLSKFAMGTTWFDAILLGGAGPGAVFVNELFNIWFKKADSSLQPESTT